MNKFHDELLGDVVLSHEFNARSREYKANIKIDGKFVALYLYSNPDSGEIDSSLKTTRTVVENFEENRLLINAHLSECFIPKLSENSGVDYDDQEVLKELEIENITIHSNGKFSFGFGSLESLDGHSLLVYFSAPCLIDCCDIVG